MKSPELAKGKQCSVTRVAKVEDSHGWHVGLDLALQNAQSPASNPDWYSLATQQRATRISGGMRRSWQLLGKVLDYAVLATMAARSRALGYSSTARSGGIVELGL